MPIETFSGNPISSTYQRVVQTDGTYLGDGTGSIINNLTLPGNLIVSGTLYAQNTVVVTQSFSSGSNILGDAINDTQTLYGTVRIPTGSLTVTGSTSIRGTTTVTSDGYALTLKGTDNRTLNFRAEGSDAFIDSSGQNFLILRSAIGVKLQRTSGTDVSVVLGSDPQSISVNSGTLSFNTQNTNRITILSGSGYVGINQTTPTSQLQVKGSGTTSATTALLVQNSNATSSLVVLDNGYVGINTGSAAYNLDVNGTLRASGNLTVQTASDATLTFNSNNAQITWTGGAFGVYYNSTRLLRISNGGEWKFQNKIAVLDNTTVTGVNSSLYTQTPIAASSALAQGVYFNNTLVAAANNDTLVGLDIQPTFNTGSFTGTNRLALRAAGNVLVTGSTTSLGGFTGSLSGSATSALTASSVDPLNQAVLISGSLSIQGTDTSTSTKAFHVQTGDGTSIMDFRNDTYAFFGCGQGAGAASGFIFRYNNPSIVQMAGYNYGNGSGAYKPIFFDTDITGRNQGVFINYSASQQPSSTEFSVKGRGATSSTTALRVDDSNLNPSLQVTDDNVVKTGRTSAYIDATTSFIVGHKTDNQYTNQLILDNNKDDNTYYKLVLESRYFGAQPFQLYSSGIQTWLYGYGNPMFAQGPGMKIPNQTSMGTTDIGKSELSGSILFIHGQDFYAQRSYIRMTSYTTGVDTLRGSALGLWTGDRLRLWNYENTSVDLGVNNVQRLQVTPSGINVTGSIVATGNLTLGTAGRIASGEFANPAGNSSIAMGYGNTAAGNGSLVVGFISDTDSGKDYSAAIGYEARAYLPGQVSFAWGNHTFNNRDAGAQQSFLTVKNSTGVTTGATMDLSIGGNTITLLGTNRAWMVTMDWIASVSSITGTATGVSVGDTAGGTIRAVVKKVGGVTSVVGTIANDKASDASMSSLSIAFVVGGSNQLIPRITGPTFAGGGTINIKAVGGIKLSETSI